MTHTGIIRVPKQAQFVAVRKRRYAVSEDYPLDRPVQAGQLPRMDLLIAGGVGFDQDQSPVITGRSLKPDLPLRWDGPPRFSPHRLEAAQEPYPAVEKKIHLGLPPYPRLRRKSTPPTAKESATKLGLKLPKKRSFSPVAFASSLAQHRISHISATRLGAAKREHEQAAFQAHPHASPVRTLRATDQASESIDLPPPGTFSVAATFLGPASLAG